MLKLALLKEFGIENTHILLWSCLPNADVEIKYFSRNIQKCNFTSKAQIQLRY